MEIYPARELPMEGINSQWLMDKMTIENKKIVSKEDLIPEILANDAAVIVTIGAGDLGEMVPSIKSALYESL
jgi:UDP-N-acetylmuramate--alanine ligase